ncbi:uncharacterized protein [Acropora muricata]|uniref:uncharacterized protein isoform X2 n=1 Tax=Acropora muricata TaxID=159855 RepID=UPI0034E49960
MSRNKFVRSLRRLSELQKYKPPKWAASLKDIPQHFVQLAQRNTPIHPWDLAQLPKGFSLFIKRDDLTGNTLSGNKTTDIGCGGNLLLSKMVESKIIVIPQLQYKHGLKQMMEKMAERVLNQKGSSVYQIEVGGSSYTGMFGYLTAFQELIEQNVLENFDDIVVTVGSGGSASGIAIGNYLTGSKLKCHAVNVSDNAAYFYNKINEDLQAGGLDVQAEEIIDIIDGYKGRGYGLSTQHELESILEISRTTGIMMDPVYNIKAVRGMLTEMKCNPTRFRGQRILYIHTGGVFGLYDGRIDALLASSSSAAKDAQQVASWGDIDDPMPFFDE